MSILQAYQADLNISYSKEYQRCGHRGLPSCCYPQFTFKTELQLHAESMSWNGCGKESEHSNAEN